MTVLNQTPTAFTQLAQVDAAQGGELSLRVVVFGGEALNLAELRGWVERHGDERPRLVNMYGITETTVHVTYRRLTREDVEGGAGSLIGRPLSDLRLYLLDAHRQPVPAGTVGEIYVGGGGRGARLPAARRADGRAVRARPVPRGRAGCTGRATWQGRRPVASWSTSAGPTSR